MLCAAETGVYHVHHYILLTLLVIHFYLILSLIKRKTLLPGKFYLLFYLEFNIILNNLI